MIAPLLPTLYKRESRAPKRLLRSPFFKEIGIKTQTSWFLGGQQVSESCLGAGKSKFRIWVRSQGGVKSHSLMLRISKSAPLFCPWFLPQSAPSQKAEVFIAFSCTHLVDQKDHVPEIPTAYINHFSYLDPYQS